MQQRQSFASQLIIWYQASGESHSTYTSHTNKVITPVPPLMCLTPSNETENNHRCREYREYDSIDNQCNLTGTLDWEDIYHGIHSKLEKCSILGVVLHEMSLPYNTRCLGVAHDLVVTLGTQNRKSMLELASQCDWNSQHSGEIRRARCTTQDQPESNAQLDLVSGLH